MLSAYGLNYKVEGDASLPVLVFSNSLGTNLSMWDKVVAELKDHFRILRYDTRGHGESLVNGPKATIIELAIDLLNLMDELKISKAWFCGISIGGITGMKLALMNPERFSGFILANTSPRIATPDVWKNRIELVKENGLAPVALGTPARWFTPEYVQKNASEVSHMIDVLSSSSPKGYRACCEALVDENLWDEIGSISSRCLIISGKYDEITTIAEAEKMQQLIRGSRLKILEANHLSSVECPEEFSKAILDFTGT